MTFDLDYYDKIKKENNNHTLQKCDCNDQFCPYCNGETNKLIRAWIWLWYNDITRICVLIGLPVIPVIVIARVIFDQGEYLRLVAGITYVVFFGWAILDNDYSNLRRIGMDERRKNINLG